jgi:phage-related protein
MGVQTDTVSSKKSRNNANYLIFKRFANDSEVLDMVNKYFKASFPQLERKDTHMKIDLYKELIKDYNSLLIDNLDAEMYHLMKSKTIA